MLPGLSGGKATRITSYEDVDLAGWMATHRGLFPGVFTLMVFAIFGSPVMSGIRLATDTSVLYWIGWHGWLVLLVPILLMAGHFVHASLGRPNMYVLLASTVVPSIILIAIGLSHVIGAGRVSSRLLSFDCAHFDDKAWLEQAHTAATHAFDDCVNRVLATSPNRTAEEVRVELDARMCKELNGGEMQKYSHQLDYLANLEETQGCSGWCQQAKLSLFHPPNKYMDSCSGIVGVKINTQVKSIARRLYITGLVDLVISLFALAVLQEFFIKNDIRW